MSEFLKRKLRTFFTVMDYDKDGVQTKEGWVTLGTRFANFENADQERVEDIKNRFSRVRYMYSDI